MNGLRLLVDQDGVLADWYEGIFTALEVRGEDITILDVTRWDLGADKRTRSLVKEIQATPGFYRNLPPIPGAKDVLERLHADGHSIQICTTPDATNPTCASDKIAWVREHLGGEWVHRMVMTHDKTIVRGDILIDDKPEITGSEVPRWSRVIFDQPYNRHVIGPRLTRWDAAEVAFSVWEAVATR